MPKFDYAIFSTCEDKYPFLIVELFPNSILACRSARCTLFQQELINYWVKNSAVMAGLSDKILYVSQSYDASILLSSQ